MHDNKKLEMTYSQTEVDEMLDIATRDGYESAVQDIDIATGGDGEFIYCLGASSENHCPDVPSMKRRILGRFSKI